MFIKLHDAGCVLFKTWQASFFCDPNRPVCAILEFGQGVDKIKVSYTVIRVLSFHVNNFVDCSTADHMDLNRWIFVT